jgi:predicted tellurium resistance membrane protein TerC
MHPAALVAYAAVVLSVIGMMLVVAGVVATGFFLPGVVVVTLGLAALAVGGVLQAVAARSAAVATRDMTGDARR